MADPVLKLHILRRLLVHPNVIRQSPNPGHQSASSSAANSRPNSKTGVLALAAVEVTLTPAAWASQLVTSSEDC